MPSASSTSPIKPILILLFLLCLLDMPYGYFQIVRTVGMVGFIYLGYQAHQHKEELWKYFYWGSAVLINPIFKIVLGRELWNIIDIIWVIVIGYHMYQTRKKI